MFFRNFTGASKVNGLWNSNAFDGSVISIWNVCSATGYIVEAQQNGVS